MSVIIMNMSMSVFAMDKRVTASKHYVTEKKVTAADAKANKNWKKGEYKGKANGYVTSAKMHYANVALYLQYSNYSKKSGKKWGKGKVKVGTGWLTKTSAKPFDLFFSAIYYGF
ncbi:MAG: hypothetical protein PHT76_10270 [Anaerostipes sp.]|nr:hypothetical protein [Anaerostipes sp.]